jgi:CheY-like chemotaxis protein
MSEQTSHLISWRVVAVDDEPDDLYFLRRTIEKSGIAHRFQTYSNAEAALAALSDMATAKKPLAFPLICFLDIKMAGMTGLDLLKWIRKQRGLDTLPVIMYSSSEHPTDVKEARELGAQGYINKHPSGEAMNQVLEEALEWAFASPPMKTFLQWNYRFIDSAKAVLAT